MIAYLMKNFIVQSKEIIIENKTTNMRDYEITSFDVFDTKNINQEQEKTKFD